LIVYEGGLELEVKSILDIKYLHYVIKSTQAQSKEVMLCFNNKQKSNMHLIMHGDFQELFDFLKLRWVSFNKDKTLKVFGVPEKSLMQYHQTATSAKYDIENMPAEQYRIREEEVISQKDYDNLLKGIVAPLDQDSQAFDFANSRSISNDP